MPITVQHQPSFESVGNVSEAYGKFQVSRENAQKANDYAFKINMLDKQAQIAEEANQRNFERDQQARDLDVQRKKELNQDLTEYEYTTKQKMMIDNINNQISDVQINPDLTQADKDYAVRELEFKKMNIKPQSKPKSSPFPKGQDINEVWTDKNTGVTYTRDQNGTPKVLVKGKDSSEGSAMETISTKEYADLYKDVYKSMITKDIDTSKEILPKPEEVAAQVKAILVSKDNIKIEAQIYGMPPNFQKIYFGLTSLRISPKTGKPIPPLSPRAAMDIINKMKRKHSNG